MVTDRSKFITGQLSNNMGLLLFFGLLLFIVVLLGFTMITINDFEKKIDKLTSNLTQRYKFNPETSEKLEEDEPSTPPSEA
jgi:TM2 domain-containing membrane protein YozV